MRIHRTLAILILLISGVFTGSLQCKNEEKIIVPGLKEKVVVMRDEMGIAYIYAKNTVDALFAQGYVTASDRLFQMELMRLFSSGRISELAGEEAKEMDIRMRTIGFHHQAKKHARLLNAETKDYLQRYLDGINYYLQNKDSAHSLLFKISGLNPDPWSIEDSLALMYFMSWGSSANVQTEVIALMLVEKIGAKKAREIFPLNRDQNRFPHYDRVSIRHSHLRLPFLARPFYHHPSALF